jgi:hypothetical protein
MPALSDLAPDVAQRIIEKLRTLGETRLADSVPGLSAVDRCRCGDDFCATVYAVPRPKGAWGPGHRNIEIDMSEGIVILDVVKDRIVRVEILYRPDVRERVLAAFP